MLLVVLSRDQILMLPEMSPEARSVEEVEEGRGSRHCTSHPWPRRTVNGPGAAGRSQDCIYIDFRGWAVHVQVSAPAQAPAQAPTLKSQRLQEWATRKLRAPLRSSCAYGQFVRLQIASLSTNLKGRSSSIYPGTRLKDTSTIRGPLYSLDMSPCKV